MILTSKLRLTGYSRGYFTVKKNNYSDITGFINPDIRWQAYFKPIYGT